MYAKYGKRIFDLVFASTAFVILTPLLLVLTITGAIAMRGNPFFVQARPGLHEKIFKLVKFRTMTNEKDASGNLLPDEVRLNSYGKLLRASSLDELPELFNILKGDMSICGPRPQLVKDMVFMSTDQRQRHNVRPGLTGLAQVCGRNAISWEEKLRIDLEYINNITLIGDLKILLQTIQCVLMREGINETEISTASDFGDYLLTSGKISKINYDKKLDEAKHLIDSWIAE